MRVLSAPELLEIWERGLSQAPVARALELLEAVCPEASRDSLAELSVGQRDARQLRLRQMLFGSRMAGSVGCPRCGARLELTLDVADLLAGSLSEPEGEIFLTIGEYELRVRLPNSRDVVVQRPRGTYCRSTNELSFSLAPSITIAPPSVPAGSITYKVTCSPEVWPGRITSLLLGDQTFRYHRWAPKPPP